MNDMFRHIMLICTIGRVGTITKSADSAYYTIRDKIQNMETRILIKSVVAILGQILLGLLLAIQIIRLLPGNNLKDSIIGLVILTICAFGIIALHKWRKKN